MNRASIRPIRRLTYAALILFNAVTLPAAQNTAFTRLVPLPVPRITAAAEEYPGGNHRAAHLVDGRPQTEYSSNGRETGTFVEFDFGRPVRLAGFRHQDRNDPATIAASELVFQDASGRELSRQGVTHVNQRAGVTFAVIAPPIEVARVRWQVTRLGPQNYGTVGGAEITFFEAGEPELVPSALAVEVQAPAIARRSPDGLRQPVRLVFNYEYAEPLEARVQLGDAPAQPVRLAAGRHSVEFALPPAETDRRLPVAVETAAGQPLLRRELTVPAFRRLTVYILPHSHTDIGYTELQTDIEEKQVNNLLAGMAAARRTASYPEGARFVWNVEVLWAADLYLRRLDAAQRQEFREALRRGQIALCGMYLNELTGLCRPEELVQLFKYATELRRQTGAPLDTAMISDVPGYTWGTVTAMAQAGIKYFSVAPNFFDRIGDILVQWENKPFWWLGPSGRERVLVWIPLKGYAMSHIVGKLSPQWVEDYTTQLAQRNYPYDLAHIRWSGHGDNAVPDPAICEFVKDWQAQYAWPRFIISSVGEAFRAFDQKYGSQLPTARGDWTPYWEDGAGSSALETAMNRASSDRVAQAAALWALLSPRTWPRAAFEDAWRSVLLYSEHTWGAWCSVSEPNRRETLEQWAIKHGYAAAADVQSRDLLQRALALPTGAEVPNAIDLFNTTSWPRTELVMLPKDFTPAGDRLTDPDGRPVASQRLTSGELVMLARDVPPLAARRYTIAPGPAHAEGRVVVEGNTLRNERLKVVLDPQTGGLVELRAEGLDANLADTASGHALNDYLYFNGADPTTARRNGPVKIRVKEKGPLVASLVVESEAPGCFKLLREVRLVAGQDHVELLNLVDKARLVAASYHAPEGKESLNFAFPFAVPDGQVRLEVPFGIVRPDTDQIPSACKNWFTVNRWADVANDRYGVTWVTLDAPLVQVGGLTANLLNSQPNPEVWRKHVGPTQKLHSWAMNNHWGTNYRAYQEGPVLFRYVLRPHRGYDPAAATRLAVACSQPLLPVRARGPKPSGTPRLKVSSPEVLVTGLKPGDDGRGLIVRLWNADPREVQTRLSWSRPAPRSLWLSDTSEQRLGKAGDTLTLPGQGLVTLRAELP
ncbi:MAG: hypothetical protein LDL56_07295 [Armatimonadetes bacterium]|nr:hypothetical protein [Armatimonadota bacterium]